MPILVSRDVHFGNIGTVMMFARAVPVRGVQGQVRAMKDCLASRANYKLESRWESVIWLGVCDVIAEIIAGTARGIIKNSDFECLSSHDEGWNVESWFVVCGTPWEPIPGRP